MCVYLLGVWNPAGEWMFSESLKYSDWVNGDDA